MKNLVLMLLFFICVSVVSAQVTDNKQANLTVNSNKWRFQRFAQLDPDISEDIFSANDQQRAYNQSVISNARDNKLKAAAGQPISAPPPRPLSQNTLSKDDLFSVPGYYLYEISVTNSSQKTISVVTWDYIFFDKTKNQQIVSREFVSTKKISPGKTKTLAEKSNTYPTLTIDASQGGKNFKDIYSEKVFIQRIEYSDGSVWTAPANPN